MSDPYRTPDPTGPTPKLKRVAARLDMWLDNNTGTFVLTVCAAALASFTALVHYDSKRQPVECAGLCADLGSDTPIYKQAVCYCVDANHKPWRWDEWPGSGTQP